MRLIDADELKKAFKAWKTKDDYYHDTDCIDIPFSEAFDLINNAPTIEPETKVVANVTFNKEQLEELVEKAKADILAQIERPQGEWIKWNFKTFGALGDWEYKCSNCEKVYDGEYNFCPNCGARMGGTT